MWERRPCHRAWTAAGERLHRTLQLHAPGELLKMEFYSLMEVKALTAQDRQPYSRVRPHSSLCYLPPSPGRTSRLDDPSRLWSE